MPRAFSFVFGTSFFGTSFVFGTSFKPGTWCPIITLHRVILAIRRTRVRRVSSGGGLGVSFGVRLYPALALKVFSPIPFLSVQTIHSSWHHPARPLQPRINHPPKHPLQVRGGLQQTILRATVRSRHAGGLDRAGT